ncbi:hypothetical protein [Neobacillus dielmonensis]|uniref:hypothetical protein n=1 Tax=Neobacillus dielmonensis TaxID=1347369 RepID=UPI000943248D|nr:hypothetical protein [Neobacillus dielmonensis]
MNFIKNLVMFSIIVLLSSCSNIGIDNIGGCPDAEIEWVDVVMVNDIKYQHDFPDQPNEEATLLLEKGKEIAKVTYKMADHACSDHKMKNGDAAYLEKGTPIYELKGYPSSFMILADGKAYVAKQNKTAKTAGELYPLKGLLKNIHIESTEDGSRIHTFSAQSTQKFIDEWYQLKLEDPEALYKKGRLEGERVFLEMELKNAVSFRQLYWMDSNTFHVGVVGNKEIKEIISNEYHGYHGDGSHGYIELQMKEARL